MITFILGASYISMSLWIYYFLIVMERIKRRSYDIEWTFKVVWFVLSFVPIFNSGLLWYCIFEIDNRYMHTRIY